MIINFYIQIENLVCKENIGFVKKHLLLPEDMKLFGVCAAEVGGCK